MLRVPPPDSGNGIRTGVGVLGTGGGVRKRRRAGIFINFFAGIFIHFVQELTALYLNKAERGDGQLPKRSGT